MAKYLSPDAYYALNAEIGEFLKGARNAGITDAQIDEFVEDIYRRSQANLAPHNDTYKLANSWYADKTENGFVKFGYAIDYAMPVDYITGFFRAAINQSKQKYLRVWGMDAQKGLQNVQASTKPGELD